MFRGKYKKLDASGLKKQYLAGDTVLFEGNIYKAIKQTELSPFRDKQSWQLTGSNVIYSSNTPPISPTTGQYWEKDGKVYVYHYDGNNYSWAEF
jgi:hypothetical protein